MNEELEFIQRDDLYGELAASVITEKRPDILAAGIAVGFVGSYKKKVVSKDHIVFGECKKVQEIYKLYCPYDFLIVIYEQNTAGFNDDQMKILIWHELNHIGIDEKGKAYKKAHDVEEFDDIIKECGLNWNR